MTRLFKTNLRCFLISYFLEKKNHTVYTIDKEGMHSERGGGKHNIRECRGSLDLLGSNQGHIALHLTNLAMSSIIA